jgi:hypothetical protein
MGSRLPNWLGLGKARPLRKGVRMGLVVDLGAPRSGGRSVHTPSVGTRERRVGTKGDEGQSCADAMAISVWTVMAKDGTVPPHILSLGRG